MHDKDIYGRKHDAGSLRVLGCPKSVFLLQTRLLQRCIFKPNLSNIVMFILMEENGWYVIR